MPNSLIRLSSSVSRLGVINLVLPNFLCIPSQRLGFVLSFLMVNGLATESVDKQVYHHGRHHGLVKETSSFTKKNNSFHLCS